MAVLLGLVWGFPAAAMDVRLGVGALTRSRAEVGPANVWLVGGAAGELSLDWHLAPRHEAGLRFRLLVYPPGGVEADAGVGYRYTFHTGHRVRPFLGGAVTLALGNECFGGVCGVPGASGWLEGGLELRLDRVTLAAWLSPYARLWAFPHLYGGGALWVGVVF